MHSTDAQPRVLVAAEIPFWLEDSGAAVRISTMLHYLRRHGMDLAVFSTERVAPDERIRFSAAFPGVPLHTPSFALLCVRMLRRRTAALFGVSAPDGGIAVPWTWEKGIAFGRVCRAWRPQVVIASYVRLAYLARSLPVGPRPRMILDTIDVMSLRTARFAEAGLTPVIATTPQEEAAALVEFDALLAIHDEEAALLRALCPGRPVATVGHPAPARPFVYREAADLRVLFVAAAGIHNRHAIDAFLKDVWPRLRAELGQRVTCVVAGRVREGMEAPPAGVELCGFVSDRDTLYAEADVVVNPVAAGSGLKIKNVEALGYGKPLVTTSIGAEGLRAAEGRGLLIADGPRATAETLLQLCTDASERRQAAEAAHVFAREALCEDMVYRELLGLLCRH